MNSLVVKPGTKQFYLLIISSVFYFYAIGQFNYYLSNSIISSCVIPIGLFCYYIIISVFLFQRFNWPRFLCLFSNIVIALIISIYLKPIIIVHWQLDLIEGILYLFYFFALLACFPFNFDIFRLPKNIKNILLILLSLLLIGIIYTLLTKSNINNTSSYFLFIILIFSFITISISNNLGAYLKILNGKLKGKIYQLNKEIFYLGSEKNANICLSSYYKVNQNHAKIVYYEEPITYLLVSNTMDNSVAVNFRITEYQIIESGDILTIGSVLIQFFLNK